jgi:hypothetical protein
MAYFCMRGRTVPEARNACQWKKEHNTAFLLRGRLQTGLEPKLHEVNEFSDTITSGLESSGEVQK